MNRAILIFLILVLSSCTTQNMTGEVKEWDSFGYDGLAQKVNKVAGLNSVDCGIYQLLSKDGQREFKNGIRCAKANYKSGTPFKLGSVRLPIDSLAYEVLIYDENKQFTRVIYDHMIDNSDSQQWVYYCKNIGFNVNESSYDDSECIYQENIKWPKN